MSLHVPSLRCLQLRIAIPESSTPAAASAPVRMRAAFSLFHRISSSLSKLLKQSSATRSERQRKTSLLPVSWSEEQEIAAHCSWRLPMDAYHKQHSPSAPPPLYIGSQNLQLHLDSLQICLELVVGRILLRLGMARGHNFNSARQAAKEGLAFCQARASFRRPFSICSSSCRGKRQSAFR